MLTPTYKLRRLAMYDLEELVKLDILCFKNNLGRMILQRYLPRVNTIHLGIFYREHLIAALLSEHDTRELHVIFVAVHPEHRGKGLGKQLMQVIFDKARERHLRFMKLEVEVKNIVAINLYKKFGFEIIDYYPFYYEDGTDAYLMRAMISKSKGFLD